MSICGLDLDKNNLCGLFGPLFCDCIWWGMSPWWLLLGLFNWHTLSLIKSLQLIWRSGTRRWNLRVPDLQMRCSDLTRVRGYQVICPNTGHQTTWPIVWNCMTIYFVLYASVVKVNVWIWYTEFLAFAVVLLWISTTIKCLKMAWPPAYLENDFDD